MGVNAYFLVNPEFRAADDPFLGYYYFHGWPSWALRVYRDELGGAEGNRPAVANVGIDLGRDKTGMPQQLLHDAQIRSPI